MVLIMVQFCENHFQIDPLKRKCDSKHLSFKALLTTRKKLTRPFLYGKNKLYIAKCQCSVWGYFRCITCWCKYCPPRAFVVDPNFDYHFLHFLIINLGVYQQGKRTCIYTTSFSIFYFIYHYIYDRCLWYKVTLHIPNNVYDSVCI